MKVSRLLSKISKESDLKRFFGFSFKGFLAFLFSFLVSCGKDNAKNTAPSHTTNPSFKLEKSTTPLSEPSSVIKQPSYEKESCGPMPGYPCGTKYYTVSIKDFEDYN
mgnify:CR=1 FL=1